MPYKSNSGSQMSPKREKKNPVPCWILNIPETVSNQWQGCLHGDDEKYVFDYFWHENNGRKKKKKKND